MKNYIIIVYLFITALFPSVIWAQGESIFNDSIVHEIRVNFEDQDFWTTLSSDYENNYPDVPYQMASINIDGENLDSIGIRQKGFASHFSVLGDKKSMKVDFNHFVNGKKYDGLKKINFNNGAGDPAMQRDKLCYDIMNNAGVNAPRTSYAKVYLNDQYWGLYLLVEQIDRTFLKDNFSNSEGNLFKNIGNSELDWLGNNASSYQDIFELKTDPNAEAWDDFVNLMSVINQSSDEEFRETIGEVFNVDLYLKVLAVDVATSNWDSYLEHGRNFYLYQDPVTNKFNWIPWDYNFALGGNFGGLGGNGDPIDDPENCETIINGSCPYPVSDTIFLEVIAQDAFCCNTDWDDVCQDLYDNLADVNSNGGIQQANTNLFPVNMINSEKSLIKRLMNIPEFQERYYQEFCALLESNFTVDRIHPLIDQYGDLIRADIQADSNYLWTLEIFEGDLDTGIIQIPGLKRFFEIQSTILRNELDTDFNCTGTGSSLTALDISINEFMASNDSLSGIADSAGEYEDWIELFNNTSESIDLSNSYLTDDVSEPQKWNFPVGTTIPAKDFLIIWADKDQGQNGLHCNFKLNKSGDFIMLTDHNLVLDSLSFGEQSTNQTFSRIPNGTGDFIIKNHTFNSSNDFISSTQNFSSHSTKVFPNPAEDFIQVTFESKPKKGNKLQLFNGVGQLILTEYLIEKSNKIELPSVASGMYFLVLSNSDHNIINSEKISIQKN